MSKRSTLCIMLVMLVIADIAVGKSMISAYGSSGNAVTKESDENGCNGVQKETSELQENETEADELEETEMDLSGVKIDITADEVPCILGNPSEDLYSVDDDDVLSIYQNNYSKLLTCPVFTGDGCTFCLEQKFSKLTFRLGNGNAVEKIMQVFRYTRERQRKRVLYYFGYIGNRGREIKHILLMFPIAIL